jgi:hypothetical protein
LSELADYELGMQIEWTIRRYSSAKLECELWQKEKYQYI